MDKQIIAARLKALREGAGLSQAKLAKMMGISQPLIARYETAVNVPSYGALLKYADLFDVSCDYIIGRCDDPKGMTFVRKDMAQARNNDMTPERNNDMAPAGNNDMAPARQDGVQEALEKCFEPDSPAYVKFREAVLEVMAESGK
ncbi:MAG: helix-turn-helix domain-containing protein [Clostridia bacterium]|nr:helix-turn-helix domain-containing protein [Clostridia bacterium]